MATQTMLYRDDDVALAEMEQRLRREFLTISHRTARQLLNNAGITFTGKVTSEKLKQPLRARVTIKNPSTDVTDVLSVTLMLAEYERKRAQDDDAEAQASIEYEKVDAYRQADNIPTMPWDTFVSKLNADSKVGDFEKKVLKSHEAWRRL